MMVRETHHFEVPCKGLRAHRAKFSAPVDKQVMPNSKIALIRFTRSLVSGLTERSNGTLSVKLRYVGSGPIVVSFV